MARVTSRGWREVTLENVCRDVTVGYVSRMADQYVSDGVPFLRSQDIKPFKIDLSSVKFISEEFHRRLKKSALGPGDVVIVRTGYPGTAAVVSRALPIANCADLVIARPSSDLDPWFLACVFNSIWGQNVVSGSLVGSAQQHFNVGAAKRLKLWLPPLAEQRRVASILSAYDDLIENNTRRIAILEEMTRRLYEEWFVHFRFPGHERVRMVESDLGPIPEGWQVQRLEEVARVNERSISPKSAPERINYVDIASVSPGKIEAVQDLPFSDAPSRARRVVRSGDVIWSCVRPNRRSHALVIDPEPHPIVSTGFAVITPVQAPYSFLYEAVTTDAFAEYLANHATGAAYPAVNQGDFEKARFVLPSPAMLRRFNAMVEPALQLVHILGRMNTNLGAQRDLLLPKLISGEIEVSKVRAPEADAGAA